MFVFCLLSFVFWLIGYDFQFFYYYLSMLYSEKLNYKNNQFNKNLLTY